MLLPKHFWMPTSTNDMIIVVEKKKKKNSIFPMFACYVCTLNYPSFGSVQLQLFVHKSLTLGRTLIKLLLSFKAHSHFFLQKSNKKLRLPYKWDLWVSAPSNYKMHHSRLRSRTCSETNQLISDNFSKKDNLAAPFRNEFQRKNRCWTELILITYLML